jgi:hypothetical protein
MGGAVSPQHLGDTEPPPVDEHAVELAAAFERGKAEGLRQCMTLEQSDDERAAKLNAIRGRVHRCVNVQLDNDVPARQRALDRAWLLEQLDAADLQVKGLTVALRFARQERAETEEARQVQMARADRAEDSLRRLTKSHARG